MFSIVFSNSSKTSSDFPSKHFVTFSHLTSVSRVNKHCILSINESFLSFPISNYFRIFTKTAIDSHNTLISVFYINQIKNIIALYYLQISILNKLRKILLFYRCKDIIFFKIVFETIYNRGIIHFFTEYSLCTNPSIKENLYRGSVSALSTLIRHQILKLLISFRTLVKFNCPVCCIQKRLPQQPPRSSNALAR